MKHRSKEIGKVLTETGVTPDMLDYYQKMETRLTSGLTNIKRNRDFSRGIETM